MQLKTFTKEGKLSQLLSTKRSVMKMFLVCSILPMSLQTTMFLLWMLHDPVPNVTQQFLQYLLHLVLLVNTTSQVAT